MNALDVASAVLVLAGCSLALLAAVGLVRLPDVFARMHAATKPATLGLVLVAMGGLLQLTDADDLTMMVLVVALQFLTAPTGAHLVGRASYHANARRAPMVVDDLADDERAQGR
jgi:multicomponent Na+:H+ antiporter subunit G